MNSVVRRAAADIASTAVGTATLTSPGFNLGGRRGLYITVTTSSYTDGTWTPDVQVEDADGN